MVRLKFFWLSSLILFPIISTFLFFATPLALASVPSGKVGLGPIKVNTLTNNGYPSGDFEISGNTSTGQTFDYKSNGASGCPGWLGLPIAAPSPCIPEQYLNADPSERTTINITSIKRFVNGTEDTGGTFSLDSGSSVKSNTITLATGEEANWLAYDWNPQVSAPSVLLSNPLLSPTDTEHVTINIPDPKSINYQVKITNLNQTSGQPLGYTQINCTPPVSCNDTSTSGAVQNPAFSNNKLTFDIAGSSLTANNSYTVEVDYFNLGQPYSPPEQSFLVTDPSTQTLHLQLSPASLDTQSSKGAKITITLVDGTSSLYEVDFPTTGTTLQSGQQFNCSGPNCSTSINLDSSGLPAGFYAITAFNMKDTTVHGNTTLTVTNGGNNTGTNCNAQVSASSAQIVCTSLTPNAGYSDTITTSSGILLTSSNATADGSGNVTFSSSSLSPGTYMFKVVDSSSNAIASGTFTVGGSSGAPTSCTSNCTIGGGNTSGCSDGEINTAIGCVPTDPATFINKFLTFAIGAAGGIALLIMAFGSIQMIAAAGNQEAIKAGRERFVSAIIGLVFIIFAVFLLQVIGVDIFKIPGFNP